MTIIATILATCGHILFSILWAAIYGFGLMIGIGLYKRFANFCYLSRQPELAC